MINYYGIKKKGLIGLLISIEVEKAASENREIDEKLKKVLMELDMNAEGKEALHQHWFTLASVYCSRNQIDTAIQYYEDGVNQTRKLYGNSSNDKYRENVSKLYTISSWNFGCSLIRHGEFKLGWKLFDHGLRTPADSAQRWQRALYKPFSFSKVKVWKGENLENKNILYLVNKALG